MYHLRGLTLVHELTRLFLSTVNAPLETTRLHCHPACRQTGKGPCFKYRLPWAQHIRCQCCTHDTAWRNATKLLPRLQRALGDYGVEVMMREGSEESGQTARSGAFNSQSSGCRLIIDSQRPRPLQAPPHSYSSHNTSPLTSRNHSLFLVHWHSGSDDMHTSDTSPPPL